ncbi:hypothetical protein TKK_0019213 [Trichogramma kaykai]|uniref:Transcription elongation factor SPT5 n=1 Tax=Trichogramma kaykai TaxID=54128 RepID=A0ABD2VUB8_9HYME
MSTRSLRSRSRSVSSETSNSSWSRRSAKSDKSNEDNESGVGSVRADDDIADDSLTTRESSDDDAGSGSDNNDTQNDGDSFDSFSEDDERQRPKKKPKKLVSDFILQEAEVDDDAEDEEEWEDGAHELGIVENEIEELGPTARDIEGRRRISNMWDSQKEEEIEEYLRNKYANEAAHSKRFGDGGEDMNNEITQKTLLPDVKDPNLWLVKCRIGEENATILLLHRKYLTFEDTDEALKIKSAVAPRGIKGFIYVEAYKQVHVKAAIENISTLKIGYWQQKMVPIKEMTDVLRVTNRVNLKPLQWVRIKRGLYKDDIAQVDYVDVGQNKAHLKLLPRIDYLKLRGALRLMSDEKDEPVKRKKKGSRPAQKPFDPEAIRAIGGDITSSGDYLVFEGNHYSHKGFLYKDFNLNAIVSDSVKPTLSEIESFEENPENVNLELNQNDPFTSQKGIVTHSFSVGDNVEVCEGELANLLGKVISVDGNSVQVAANHEQLKEPIEFPVRELKKYFVIGDHVKVLSGKYEGDTGLIVRIEGNRAVLFSDLSMHELEVLTSNLQLCPDIATGVDSLGKFQWGDMVQIDPQSVGVIVRLERENFQLLTMHGRLIDVKPGSISKYRENKNTLALDCQQNAIRRKDIVKVVEGLHAGRQGEIKHLYRSFAFLHSKIYIDTGGMLVCKTRHLQLVGGSKSDAVVNYTTPIFMSPARSERSVDGNNDKSKGRNYTRIGNLGPSRDRKIIGHTIKITGGPYKGNIGFVKDATESTARVELHSPCQTISVDRSHIFSISQPDKSNQDQNLSTPMYREYGKKTPLHPSGSQTPMHGSQTPMHGSQTPLYETGNRTPYYGSITPQQDGSRTPNPTGAWDPTVSNTPARSSEYDDRDGNNDSMDDVPFSPYQESQTSSMATPYDPANASFDTQSESPSVTPNIDFHYSESPASPTGLTDASPQIDYSPFNSTADHTPSSPMKNNTSEVNDNKNTEPPFYGSPASPEANDNDTEPNFNGSPASPEMNDHNDTKPIFYGSLASQNVNGNNDTEPTFYGSPASPEFNDQKDIKPIFYGSPASPGS